MTQVVNPQQAPAVELRVPAAAHFARLVRLTTATLAADVGLDVDDIEDLRTGVNEMFAVVIDEAAADAQVKLSFTAESGQVVIEGRLPVEDGSAPVLDQLASEILAVVADEHSLSAAGGECRFRVVKRIRANPGIDG